MIHLTRNKSLILAFLMMIQLSLVNCKDDNGESQKPDDDTAGKLYFPEGQGQEWAKVEDQNLVLDPLKLDELNQFLSDHKTRAFIVLKGGKIWIEEYFGNGLDGKPFDHTNNWYWASAGKTLTGSLIGIAEHEGLIKLDNPSSAYLGIGWSTLDRNQEEKITVRHHLSMTTGLDDGVKDNTCTEPECFVYKADPGLRWAYHNGPYTILDSVISKSTQKSFDVYFKNKLKDKIGMGGFWTYLQNNHVYFSDARSMARFGLLVLADGIWHEERVLQSTSFVEDMRKSSQDINLSYGYLWWLNGKTSHMLPGLQWEIDGPITPNAPNDMYAAIGKNGQIINIVPSQDLVVIRMGENPDASLVPTKFQNDLWGKLKDLFPQ